MLFGKWRRYFKNKECEYCRRTFRVRADKKPKFCSLECTGKSIRGENHPKWRGGRKTVHRIYEKRQSIAFHKEMVRRRTAELKVLLQWQKEELRSKRGASR